MGAARSPLTPDEIVLDLERHLLELMRWPARLVPLAVVAFVALSWARHELSPWAIGLVGGYAVVGAGVLAPRLCHATRKRLVIGGVAVAAIAGLLWYGPFLGVGVLFLSATGLAAWLDTRAGTIATIAVLSAVFPICALCVDVGWLEAKVPTIAYLRVGLASTMQMIAFAYVMRRLRARQFELLSANWEAKEESARLAARSQQAQKMESLGTLAGGIAHDFNNLLAVILPNVELARIERDPVRRSAQLDDIKTAANRAVELVRQILSFSRKSSTIRVVTALARVVEDASRLLRASIPAGIEIATTLPDDLPSVLVDAGQLHQVLMNLGTNAWHAIEGPTGRIAIDVAAVELPAGAPLVELPGGRYIRIRITDNGIGMDAATCARVFEPFFSTKPVGKGTGLGMSVAHGIVANHGGAIAVESAPGRGTTVDVYLPDSGPHQAAAAPPPAPAVPTGIGRVLVVDDEQLVATTTARVIRRLGYQVTSLLDGAAALDAVTAEPGRFDLVVTDENMPGIGGLELARRIKLVRGNLPIVLASGNSQHSDAELAAVGVHHRVAKPYDPAELGHVLAAALAETRRPGSEELVTSNRAHDLS